MLSEHYSSFKEFRDNSWLEFVQFFRNFANYLNEIRRSMIETSVKEVIPAVEHLHIFQLILSREISTFEKAL